jgi:hypothetical protein
MVPMDALEYRHKAEAVGRRFLDIQHTLDVGMESNIPHNEESEIGAGTTCRTAMSRPVS